MAGEQYALPEAASLLADVRRDAGQGAEVEVAGADPLNLTGALLGGDRIPSVRHRTVHYRNGVLAEPPQPIEVADPR
jgi:ATP-dependent Lhr-like helicase